MTFSYPIAVAIRFNDHINNRDLEKLTDLMTEDHIFIDSYNDVFKGRERMKKGWAEFFERYPDYRDIFTRVESRRDIVILIGFSKYSYEPLDGPAIWTAVIRNNLVAEWRVYKDNEENRKRLDIK